MLCSATSLKGNDVIVETFVIAMKELKELWRQPKTLVLIVFGPFLVLAAFGAGYRNEEVALRTAFVGPDEGPYEEAIERYSGSIDDYVVPVAFTSNFVLAIDDLKADRVDIVIVLPPRAEAAALEGQQSEIAVIHNSIDPIKQIGIDFATEVAVRELNAKNLLLPYAIGLVVMCAVVHVVIVATGNKISVTAQLLTGGVALYYAAFLIVKHKDLRRIRFGPLVAHGFTYVVVNGSFQLHAVILAFANSSVLRGNQDLPVDPGWMGPTYAMAGFWAIGFTIHAFASIGQRGCEQ